MQVCTPCRQPRKHPTTQFFTGRMPFLTPNQQRQSTEGNYTRCSLFFSAHCLHIVTLIYLIPLHYYICLMAFFQDNLGKLAPEKQNHSDKTNLDFLEQEIVSGSGISWAISKSTPCLRKITMSAPHHLVFYRPDALPAAQPTASNQWRQIWFTWYLSNSSAVAYQQ